MTRRISADDAATGAQGSAEGVGQLLLNHVSMTQELRSQMRQANFSVRGEGRIATEGVFAQIADRIDAIVVLLMASAVACGVAIAKVANPVGAVQALLSYPLGVADEHAHAFAVSCALAFVAQAARDGADSARAMGDPENESLLHEIARRVDADIWVVQQSLSAPMGG